MTLDVIIERLTDRNLSKVARATSLSPQLVWKICNNKSDNPTYRVVKKLSDYLEGNQ